MDLADNIWNLLLVVFWFGIWNGKQRSIVFNPYVARIEAMTGRIAYFVKPAFSLLPVQAIMVFLFILLIFLRGALFHGTAAAHNIEWGLSFGIARSISCKDVPHCIVFSFLSFLLFMLRFWTLHLLYFRSLPAHPGETIASIAAPFPAIRREFQPFVLLFIGMAAAVFLDLTGKIPTDYQGSGVLSVTLLPLDTTAINLLSRILLVSLAGCLQILPILSLTIIVLIVAFWISLLLQKQDLFKIASDWSQFFLYPLRSRINLIIGTLDLVPILFVLLASFSYSLLITIIYVVILRIP